MDRLALHDHLRTDGEVVALALAEAPDAAVPTCPGWNVAKLALHVGLAHVWAGEQVRRGTSDPLAWSDLPRAPAGRERLDWLRQATADLLSALDQADPEAPAGQWLGMAVTAAFWSRRMAHETAVHRVDADVALGRRPTLERALGADGVDELLGVILPRVVASRSAGDLPTSSLCLAATDVEVAWRVEITTPGALQVEHGKRPGALQPATATLSGPAGTLDLWGWGRLGNAEPSGTGELDVQGDDAAVAAWRNLLRL